MKTKILITCVLIAAIALTNGCGKDDEPTNKNPVASFMRSAAIAVIGAQIEFTDASTDEDGTVVSWSWDFGDGIGTSMDQNPIYKFPNGGTFSVELTVTDDAGGTSSAVETVRIEGNFVKNWEFSTTGTIGTSAPAIGDDGKIYIGSQDQKIYAINPDGTEAWSFETDNKVRSTPAIGTDGTVYVGGIDGNLYALDPSSGSQKWAFSAQDEIFIGGPSVNADGTIYFGTRDTNVPENFYAVNPDGSRKWAIALGEGGIRVRSSAAISSDGNTIYIGTYDANLYALNASDGSIKWMYTTEGRIESSPAIGSDGTIYFGCDDGHLYAINSGGTLNWRANLDKGEGARAASSPAIGPDGTIYIGTKETKSLHAISSSGTELWAFPTEDIVISAPFVGDDGVVYFGSFDGKLYAVNSDGTERFSITSGAEPGSDPARDGRVWSGPVVVNGILYYGTYDQKVYAYSVSSFGPANSAWPMRGKNPQRTGK